MNFEIENIENKLNEFDVNNWKDFFDNIFEFREVPKELSFNYSFATDYFFDLYNLLLENQKYDSIFKLQNNLVIYYFEIPFIQCNTKKLYSLHWLFANMNLKTSLEELYLHFFREDLIELYNENINLHTSLLSLLDKLPKLDEFPIFPYLMNNAHNINDLTFFRVSLKYLIHNESQDSYFLYLEQVIRTKKNEKMALIVVESFMDYRDAFGSFKKLYLELEPRWFFWCNLNLVLSKNISALFSKKYLTNGKKWYDNDNYSKFLKALMNSFDFPVPVTYIKKLYDISQNDVDRNKSTLMRSLRYLVSKKERWNHNISIDYDELNDTCFISVEKLDDILLKNYKTIYNLDKKSLYIVSDNNAFSDFITKHCDNDYEVIKKFEKENEYK